MNLPTRVAQWFVATPPAAANVMVNVPLACLTPNTKCPPAVLAKALTGIDCLIHLAATPDDSHFPPQPTNNFESELLNRLIVSAGEPFKPSRQIIRHVDRQVHSARLVSILVPNLHIWVWQADRSREPHTPSSRFRNVIGPHNSQ